MKIRRALGLLVALSHLGGCTTKASAPRENPSGTADAPHPMESVTVKLTLHPFYGYSQRDGGTTALAPIDGVNVCVNRSGPYGGAWKDFVLTGGPCVIAQQGEDVVLDGVPASSELVITAEKEGYSPSTFAVTTNARDTDTTAFPFGADRMRLRSADSEHTDVPASIDVDPQRGEVDFFLIALSANYNYQDLAGARVALVGDGNDGGSPTWKGPFFSVNGTSQAQATRTLNGEYVLPDGGLAKKDVWTTFVNVPEGLYRIVVSDSAAVCRAAGYSFGDDFAGFTAPLGEVRVPVLDGHLTPSIVAQCLCTDELAAPGTASPPFLKTCGLDAAL